jgi:alkylated DNA repair dioxygenase AlkB
MPTTLITPAKGLIYTSDFLNNEQQEWAQQWIDASDNEWRNDLSRRIQQYGWRYDYKARAITPDMYIGELPQWLQNLARHLYDTTLHPITQERLFQSIPEQCIVNEYVGSQGIAEHTDHKGFGGVIATISLISTWDMLLAPKYKDNTIPVTLETGSCLIMTGPSRHIWTHQIPRDTNRPINQRRISLTFRTVLNKDGINDH